MGLFPLSNAEGVATHLSCLVGIAAVHILGRMKAWVGLEHHSQIGFRGQADRHCLVGGEGFVVQGFESGLVTRLTFAVQAILLVQLPRH